MTRRMSPDEALARVFDILLQEIADNPRLKRRLLDALGVEVTFEGDGAAPAVDPILLAARGEADFRHALEALKSPSLKKLARDFALAEPAELSACDKTGLIDLMWTRASRRLKEIRVQSAA